MSNELLSRKGFRQVGRELSHVFQIATFPNQLNPLERIILNRSLPKEMRRFKHNVWHSNEVWASNSENYSHAFFGRDSIETAEDALPFDTSLARDVIFNLGTLQGRNVNGVTEEEPGKIIHEFRQKNGKHPQVTQDIFQGLHKKWGEKGQDFVSYYGSVDATPLYIRLVADYCERVGNTKILGKKVVQKDGRERTIQEVVWDGLEWLKRSIEEGPRGHDGMSTEPHPGQRIKLLEFKRMNGQGIDNQIWKDSGTSLVHTDGTIVNHDYPVASVELQGLAYDALTKGTSLFKRTQEKQDTIKDMLLLAREVRQNTLSQFWMSDKKYFAVALDRDKYGHYRQVRTIESNAAELLNTGFFDNLPEDMKRQYTTGIVTTIYSNNFLTDVGVRCRSLEYADLVDYWDYHGSQAVWPKETYDVAKGFIRQGFPELARQLLYRMKNGMKTERSYAELFYVDSNGTVAYNPAKLVCRKKTGDNVIVTTSIPEIWQTWSWSAFIGSKLLASRLPKQNRLSWQYNLENDLLSTNPLVSELSFKKASRVRRESYVIDQKAGFEKEGEFIQRKRKSLAA